MKKIVLFFIVSIVALFIADFGSAANHETSETAKYSAPNGVNPVWIVVNLFTGRSSKQAVIVQETLERLGAEGREIGRAHV